MISIREKKYIKSLQIKKYRQQHQAFLVEGWKSVKELIDSKFQIELLLISDKFRNECSGRVVDSKEINEVSSLATNNEALAVVKMPQTRDEIVREAPIFIFDGIQDPGNLGTIIRTADWLGIRNIICSTDSVDFYNPKVITSTKGSFLRVVPQYRVLSDFIDTLESKQIIMADLEGEDFKKFSFKKDSVIIFGGESKGIRNELRVLINDKISILKKGEAESLNVAMSFGIIAANL